LPALESFDPDPSRSRAAVNAKHSARLFPVWFGYGSDAMVHVCRVGSDCTTAQSPVAIVMAPVVGSTATSWWCPAPSRPADEGCQLCPLSLLNHTSDRPATQIVSGWPTGTITADAAKPCPPMS
jgi:hypothetical protein